MRRGNNNFNTCYDCHQIVPGSFSEHHKICNKSRRNKSDLKKNEPRSFSKSTGLVEGTKDLFCLLDVSSSMMGTLIDAKSALIECFNLLDKNDRFSIVAFDTGAFFKLKPRSVEQLRRQNELPDILGRIFAQGNTAIYDAIWITIDQIFDRHRDTRLVVITDGDDNSSRHTLDEVKLRLAEFPKIRLDIIHIGRNPSEIYASLTSQRGEYVLLTEVNMLVQVTIQIVSREN